MAYSDFSFQEVLVKFGLGYETDADLFRLASEVMPTPVLAGALERGIPLASLINTEKAWSEQVISPILLDVRMLAKPLDVTLFSGSEFNVDPADKLTGYCDFILGRGPQFPYVTAPLVMIVEAKKEDINGRLGQCAAAMVAAQRFNEREHTGSGPMYGCVTSGPVYRFVKLHAKRLTLDEQLRSAADLPKLLGIFLHILGVTPKGA